jgi:hypothetical protein
MKRLVLLLALIASSSACRTEQLSIVLSSPVALEQGTLDIKLLDIDDGRVVAEQTGIDLSQPEWTIAEDIELDAGHRYRIEASGQNPACRNAGQLFGRIPSFQYAGGNRDLTLYLGCADEFAPQPAREKRFGHGAVWAPYPSPLGSVVIAGGFQQERGEITKPFGDRVLLTEVQRYDLQTERVEPVDGSLQPPRAFPSTLTFNGLAYFLGGLRQTQGGDAVGADAAHSSNGAAIDEAANFVGGRYDAAAIATTSTIYLFAGASTLEGLGNVSVIRISPDGAADTLPIELEVRHASAVIGKLDDQNYVVFGGNGRISGAFFGNPAKLTAELVCVAQTGCQCQAPFCTQQLRGYGVTGVATSTGLRDVRLASVECDDQGKRSFYLIGGEYDESSVTRVSKSVHCIDSDKIDTGYGQPIGELLVERREPTVSVVGGPAGSKRVLVVGGFDRNPTGSDAPSSAELFDAVCPCPAQLTNQKKIDLDSERVAHSASMLPDGSVLLIGGGTTDGAISRFMPAR